MQQNDLSKTRARDMRKAMSPAERALWYALRDRRFSGLKFRRQVPLGPYIADFYCPEYRLVVEADGGGHTPLTDALHDRWLADHGFRVLRFWNSAILHNLPGCLDLIAKDLAP